MMILQTQADLGAAQRSCFAPRPFFCKKKKKKKESQVAFVKNLFSLLEIKKTQVFAVSFGFFFLPFGGVGVV